VSTGDIQLDFLGPEPDYFDVMRWRLRQEGGLTDDDAEPDHIKMLRLLDTLADDDNYCGTSVWFLAGVFQEKTGKIRRLLSRMQRARYLWVETLGGTSVRNFFLIFLRKRLREDRPVARKRPSGKKLVEILDRHMQ
jgi:hypothetical protein